MSNVFTSIKNIFRFQKLKIALFFVFFGLFAIIMFPYNDLGDVVTAKVLAATQNAIYLQFSDLKPSFFPQPGLKLVGVTVDTPVVQSLKAHQLTISPKITSFLAFKPGINLAAEGIFNGNANVSVSLPGFTIQKGSKAKVQASTENLDVAEIMKTLKVPIELGGSLSLETEDLEIDPTNLQQTSGQVAVTIKNPKLGIMTLNTPLGPLPLPPLAVSSMDLKAQARKGTVQIERFALGKSGDEISATARGQFDLKNSEYFGLPIGAYDFSIELEIQSALETKLGVIWSTLESFIDTYKRASGPGKKSFAFRVSSQSPLTPPKVSAYQ